ncbi:MAG: hypothetical protein H6658_01970 [Ardenticatenaceae bacterium]|nr:hypothetical protein [Ardenticatenaceae bacterium]
MSLIGNFFNKVGQGKVRGENGHVTIQPVKTVSLKQYLSARQSAESNQIDIDILISRHEAGNLHYNNFGDIDFR